MPIKILQKDNRVAEIQLTCEVCGKPVRTSLVTRIDLEDQKNKTVTCWQCKQTKSSDKKL